MGGERQEERERVEVEGETISKQARKQTKEVEFKDYILGVFLVLLRPKTPIFNDYAIAHSDANT